jgi:hypothetical protein
MTSQTICEIAERDEAGNITATYVVSGESRVDVIVRFLHLPLRKFTEVYLLQQ